MSSSKQMVVSIVAASLFMALPVLFETGRAQTSSQSAAPQPVPQHAQQAGPPASMAGKTAAEYYKNIQVLKDVPADQVIPAMQFMAASLGVECEHCHVGREFDKDDKQPKKTARQMMQMMFAINKDNFKGHQEVSCFTCHHAAADPVSVPLVAESDMPPPREGPRPGEGTATAPALPGADEIIAKYVKAVGGMEAVNKITSRVEKGSINFGGQQVEVEVFQKAPDKRLTAMHTPRGDSVTAFDGQVGWMAGGPGPAHEMTRQEAEAFKLDADMHFPTDAPTVFQQVRVRPGEKIDDHETYQLIGLRPGVPPVRLYFDKDSGLLVREVRYAETPLGRMPTQIDYADYREAEGEKIPFRWTLSRPNGRFTIQINSAQTNVTIDNTKFSQPAAH